MIKIVKLISGEDVIANISRFENYYILNKPHKLILTQQGLGSMPLCPFSVDEDYRILESCIVWEAIPEKEIEDSYTSSLSSIVMPNPSLIV